MNAAASDVPLNLLSETVLPADLNLMAPGAGIRLAAGVSEVVVNRGLVQKFGIGVTDTDAATNVHNTLRELSVRDHAIAGVVITRIAPA